MRRGDTGGRCEAAAVEGRHGLSGQDERDGLMAELHDDLPRLDDLVRVTGSECDQARDRAK